MSRADIGGAEVSPSRVRPLGRALQVGCKVLQGNKMLQAIIFLAIAQSATGIATKPKQMGGVTFCDDREVGYR